MVNKVTSFGAFVERNCSAAIVLDKRSNRKDMVEYPLSIRFTIDRKSYYYHVWGSYNEKDFTLICTIQKASLPNTKKRYFGIVM